MTQSIQHPPKPQTAAQRASETNRVAQMQINHQLGRPTPPPRDPEAAKKAYEERHNTSSHRR